MQCYIACASLMRLGVEKEMLAGSPGGLVDVLHGAGYAELYDIDLITE
jgi:hypothetical protein